MQSTVPDSITHIFDKGLRTSFKTDDVSHQTFYTDKRRARKWRQLMGELWYDLPVELRPYIVSTQMPKDWLAYTNAYDKIQEYTFVLDIPNFLRLGLHYKESTNSSEWSFHRYEIYSDDGAILLTNFTNLPLCLFLCHALKNPKKNKVQIEEIKGKLSEGVKLKKLEDVWEAYYGAFGCWGC